VVRKDCQVLQKCPASGEKGGRGGDHLEKKNHGGERDCRNEQQVRNLPGGGEGREGNEEIRSQRGGERKRQLFQSKIKEDTINVTARRTDKLRRC